MTNPLLFSLPPGVTALYIFRFTRTPENDVVRFIIGVLAMLLMFSLEYIFFIS